LIFRYLRPPSRGTRRGNVINFRTDDPQANVIPAKAGIVIDLSKSDSLTSIGIRALVVIHKMLSTENGSHLKLAGVMPPIRDMLDVAGITQFIGIYDTVEEAVAAF
jgi:anti-anti-sigma factor